MRDDQRQLDSALLSLVDDVLRALHWAGGESGFWDGDHVAVLVG